MRGLEVAYHHYGPREGRPFVLIHGFTGSSDDWREHLPALGELGATLAPDLRGHGDTTNLGDVSAYTLDALVDDLTGMLDALGIERCDLLGHSMGGMLTLRFALAHPERLHSLVLMDTADVGLQMAPPEQFAKLLGIVEAGGTEALLGVIKGGRAEPAPAQAAYEERVGPERAWARVEAKLRAMDPLAFIGFARAIQEQASIRDELGAISCPTLVMVGEQDAPFLAHAQAMAERIPSAHKVVIPDAAHSPQLENPAPWLAAIRAHLEGARSTR